MKNHRIVAPFFLSLFLLLTGCSNDMDEALSDVEASTIVTCPTFAFTRTGDELIANFRGIENLSQYGWYVNNVHVENEGTDDRYKGDNRYNLTAIQPGTYTICIKSLVLDCSPEPSYCDEIIIE